MSTLQIMMYVDPYCYVHVHVSSSCFIKGVALKELFSPFLVKNYTTIDLAFFTVPPKGGYSHL